MSERAMDEVRNGVREHYGKLAAEGACAPGCCGTNPNASLELGYSAGDLAAVPEGANLGLGCGNPQAIAALRDAETVLDLGSGAGFDAFLAWRQVGPRGRVIGVDMTPAMVSKARANAERIGATNVQFLLGEIEHLPVGDGVVDVILSNCVINLSPDKSAVFREALRVLKPGGRLAVSDVVATSEIPSSLREMLIAHAACVAGAASVGEVESMLVEAGFERVKITVRPESREFISTWLPGSGAESYVASASIEAYRPGGAQACCGPEGCDVVGATSLTAKR